MYAECTIFSAAGCYITQPFLHIRAGVMVHCTYSCMYSCLLIVYCIIILVTKHSLHNRRPVHFILITRNVTSQGVRGEKSHLNLHARDTIALTCFCFFCGQASKLIKPLTHTFSEREPRNLVVVEGKEQEPIAPKIVHLHTLSLNHVVLYRDLYTSQLAQCTH